MIELSAGKSYGYGGNISSEELRHNFIEPIDVLKVDLLETGVKDLRVILSKSQEKPYGKVRLLWLQNCKNVSEVIQNTLLKIVEEPPASTTVVLQTDNGSELLPTLRSRLHFISSGGYEPVLLKQESVFPDNNRELGVLLTSIKERDVLRGLIRSEISRLKEVFLETPSEQISGRIRLLSKSERELKQNCNQKLVIDHLLLYWGE